MLQVARASSRCGMWRASRERPSGVHDPASGGGGAVFPGHCCVHCQWSRHPRPSIALYAGGPSPTFLPFFPLLESATPLSVTHLGVYVWVWVGGKCCTLCASLSRVRARALSLSLSLSLSLCVCVCVCVRERERERVCLRLCGGGGGVSVSVVWAGVCGRHICP
jgi:hypothetical protein